ncbi:MAG: GH3 auxin-responsive promoter family protein [Lewinellaceae bacterium]|nr:GH3 auxin-responsive promoter family protein [Saprospiraceae bacterium]MCB9337760.1 GH3 auxin-responsive promoter family protein [Lewinellaceae bacterium]
MRRLANRLFKQYLDFRMRHIRRYIEHPHEVQKEWLERLLLTARDTEWGKNFDFKSIKSYRQYASRIPIQDYEAFKPFIKRMMEGEKDVLWNGRVRYFSKSSGTTGDKSKFIPVSSQNLRYCHKGGSWDTTALFYNERQDARLFEKKSLLMGGSLNQFSPFPKTIYGDVSAVMISQMPFFIRPFFTPDFETALMPDFEKKIERMAGLCSQEDVVMLGGVPTWTVVLFRHILELTGKKNILEVWPNLQGYIHGGVSFTPYREQFKLFFPGQQVSYQEVYNASEGYFAIQNDFSTPDMLLLLDNGVYYEFIPMEEWNKEQPRALPLSGVEIGKNYAMVISTNAGLWRYSLGDTVCFTSVSPYKIRITGRTRQFVNAFGEEVMVENTDQALAKTCAATGAVVLEYSVAPVYFKGSGKGGHEWLVEFEKMPDDLNLFSRQLDENLKKLNSDYEAKRFRSMAMAPLFLQAVPPGTFHKWLKMKGKYGGQHKVPRLSNDRKYMDDILGFLQTGETTQSGQLKIDN